MKNMTSKLAKTKQITITRNMT